MSNYCLTPGTILGDNYQIIKRIGQGGMGAVYMAYDLRLDLQVAIKTISPESPDEAENSRVETTLKRFEAEARIAAKIDHPNVIRIHGFQRDFIEVDGKTGEIDYLVMELLTGRTLRNTMDISGFEHEEEIAAWTLKYMIPILDGLEKVHSCGIIHRDIKPENFLMKEDTPKIADFGLSMGFDFPAVTGSIADIFGTVPYMAPEQFFNFSMARQTADIYSIGKILYEIVEGRISDKIKPFKQASLSHPDTEFLKRLDCIIRNATAENVEERTPSTEELRNQLMELIYCKKTIKQERRRRSPNASFRKRTFTMTIFLLFMAAGAWGMHFAHDTVFTGTDSNVKSLEDRRDAPERVRPVPYVESSFEPVVRTADNSTLHLIPPAKLTLKEGRNPDMASMNIDPFYLSENPVTNQQYVTFLNEVADRITIEDGDVFIDNRLAVTLSEKIRDYMPFGYDGQKFHMRNPMHSACAVLLVTGFGAEAYARHYGMRLPAPREWLYIALTETDPLDRNLALPTPVIDYEKNSLGLRGIGQLAEWGKTSDGDLVAMGPGASEAELKENFDKTDLNSYFPDTGFRVAKKAIPNTLP